MTLADLIKSDVDDVFLDTDEFAESVTHWPAGVEANAATITAIVVRDAEDQGVAVSDDAGEQIAKTAHFLVDDDESITVEDREIDRDIFVTSDGDTWRAVRIVGRDAGMLTIEAVSTAGIRQHRSRRLA